MGKVMEGLGEVAGGKENEKADEEETEEEHW